MGDAHNGQYIIFYILLFCFQLCKSVSLDILNDDCKTATITQIYHLIEVFVLLYFIKKICAAPFTCIVLRLACVTLSAHLSITQTSRDHTEETEKFVSSLP